MPNTPNARQLLSMLFEDPAHSLAQRFAGWAESAAFRAFAHTHATKIRRKLRLAQDDASLADLAWELEVAYRLCSERSFVVGYEQGGVGERRGPDFVATFRGHTPIGVEATRMRQTSREHDHAAEKLGDTVCAKLGQLLASAPNVLAVGAAEATLAQLDLAVAMRMLLQHADQRDDQFLARRGFASTAEFHKLYRRLSAIVAAENASSGPALVWLNPQAQRPLPDEARRRLVAAFHGQP